MELLTSLLLLITPVACNTAFVNFVCNIKNITMHEEGTVPTGKITLFFMVLPAIIAFMPYTSTYFHPTDAKVAYILVELMVSWVVFGIAYITGSSSWFDAKALHHEQCAKYNIDLSEYTVGQLIVTLRVYESKYSGRQYEMILHRVCLSQDLYGTFNVLKKLDTYDSTTAITEEKVQKFVQNYVDSFTTYSVVNGDGSIVIPTEIVKEAPKVIVVQQRVEKE